MESVLYQRYTGSQKRYPKNLKKEDTLGIGSFKTTTSERRYRIGDR